MQTYVHVRTTAEATSTATAAAAATPSAEAEAEAALAIASADIYTQKRTTKAKRQKTNKKRGGTRSKSKSTKKGRATPPDRIPPPTKERGPMRHQQRQRPRHFSNLKKTNRPKGFFSSLRSDAAAVAAGAAKAPILLWGGDGVGGGRPLPQARVPPPTHNHPQPLPPFSMIYIGVGGFRAPIPVTQHDIHFGWGVQSTHSHHSTELWIRRG